MSFCDHCDGQRYDRSRVLRALREARRRLRGPNAACTPDQSFALAIEAVRALDIPHVEPVDEWTDEEMVH